MRRGCFFCLLFVIFFALAGMPFSAAALDGAAKKAKGQPGSEKKSSAQQSGARQVQGQATPGAAGATEISPGQIKARSAILVEVSTGAVLFEQNADEPIEPASFTKIASLYLIFDALKHGRIHLEDEVLVSETAWRTGGSKMFVGLGSIAFLTASTAIVQIRSDPMMRGRVLALQAMVFLGSTPIGGPVLGLICDQFGARAGFVVGGVRDLVVGDFRLVGLVQLGGLAVG